MCKTAEREELAEQYVRGQLSLEQRDEFEIHLLECPKCLGRVETMNEVQFGLKTRGGVIREEKISSTGRLDKWLVTIAVTVGIVIVAIAVYFWK